MAVDFRWGVVDDALITNQRAGERRRLLLMNKGLGLKTMLSYQFSFNGRLLWSLFAAVSTHNSDILKRIPVSSINLFFL